MADRAITELTPALEVTAEDLFVLEQNNTAKKLTAQVLENWLLTFAEGHGGIQSISKSYSSGLVDTYTILYSDESTTTFTVTNGAKGDKGDNAYVWIKYAGQRPTSDADMGNTPDKWFGIYSGNKSVQSEIHYNEYKWYEIKGAKGDTGDASEVVSNISVYGVSTSATAEPSTWTETIPDVGDGEYLWTRTTLTFNSGSPAVFYTKTRWGVDGSGMDTITSENPPTTSTQGFKGQLYHCTTSNALYACEGNDGNVYNWKLIRNANKLNLNIFGQTASYDGSEEQSINATLYPLNLNIFGNSVQFDGTESKSLTVNKPKLRINYNIWNGYGASSEQGAFSVTTTAGIYDAYLISYFSWTDGSYKTNVALIPNGSSGNLVCVGNTSLTRPYNTQTDGVIYFGNVSDTHACVVSQITGIGITV